MTKRKYPKVNDVDVVSAETDLTLEQIIKGVMKVQTEVSEYTNEDRMRAVMAYIITGSFGKAAKATGIPATTIVDWKNHAHWWPEMMAKARKYWDEQLDADMTSLLHGITGVLRDRVEDGDYVVTKNGTLVRKPISARDAAMIGAIMFDKRALGRGDATSRREVIAPEDTLKKLADSFKKAVEDSRARDITPKGEIIDVTPEKSK